VTGLEKFLGALHSHRAEFIIIGGIAARIHGSARITQDVDIVYSRLGDNIGRVVAALAPFKPYLRGAPEGLPFTWDIPTVEAGLNFTLRTTAGDIDILGEVAGGGRYEDLVSHTVVAHAFGHATRVISIPWLIQLKRAAGRVKDLEAIAELELLRDLTETQQRAGRTD
jgi:hypothetical protein